MISQEGAGEVKRKIVLFAVVLSLILFVPKGNAANTKSDKNAAAAEF